MHAVTPHIHDNIDENLSSLDKKVEVKNFDWLTNCFHHDLGEGHLENFIRGKSLARAPGIDLNIKFTPTISWSEPIPKIKFPVNSLNPSIYLFSPLSSYMVTSPVRRGPPAAV